MNIIEAMEYSKKNRVKMFRKTPRTYYNAAPTVPSETTTFTMDDILADDWEIERKPLVWEGEVEWIGPAGMIYPVEIPNSKAINFTEFRGKRTKIRIEEILDKEE